jgi:hypothetical protein
MPKSLLGVVDSPALHIDLQGHQAGNVRILFHHLR